MLSDEDKKILENIGEDERIVFAGYNYRKQYHAGDMINCYVDDDIGQIKIGGILKKGAGWIHEDRLFKGSYGKWDNYTLVITESLNLICHFIKCARLTLKINRVCIPAADTF